MSRSCWSDWLQNLCAGLPWRECQRMLAGEPPARPNPRQRPHQESFWLHIKPVYYHRAVTRLTHTWRLGMLSVYFFVVELLTGLALLAWYAPTPERAYDSMGVILARAPMGELLHALHYLAAIGFILSVLLHLIRTYITASYKAPRRFTWLTGVGLLLLTLGLAFTGYLLPWDQLAYWAVTIGMSLVRDIPLAGDWLYGLLAGGNQVAGSTLLRFYVLHILLLPLVAGVLIAVHYYKVIRHGISLPSSLEPQAHDAPQTAIPVEQRRYYLLDVAVDELLFLSWISLIVLAMALFFIHPILQSPANPAHTPPEIAAPWYFLWLQGLLKLGNTRVFGLLIPGAFILLLLLLPYLDRNPQRQARSRPWALGLGALAVIALLGLSLLGLPRFHAQLPPAQALAQRYLPEEGAGKLDGLSWEALPEGDFCTDGQQPAPGTPFAHVWDDFAREIAGADHLPNARGCILIQPAQPHLKRIQVYITYEEAGGAAAVLTETYRYNAAEAGP